MSSTELADAAIGVYPGVTIPGAGLFAPAGWRRSGAQLDSRFPVSVATPVAEGFRLVTEYFTAVSQRNLDALARTLHFPFAIYEDIEPIVVPTAADLLKDPPPSLNGTGKGRTKILRGVEFCRVTTWDSALESATVDELLRPQLERHRDPEPLGSRRRREGSAPPAADNADVDEPARRHPGQQPILHQRHEPAAPEVLRQR
jgi:hypothetical protein